MSIKTSDKRDMRLYGRILRSFVLISYRTGFLSDISVFGFLFSNLASNPNRMIRFSGKGEAASFST